MFEFANLLTDGGVRHVFSSAGNCHKRHCRTNPIRLADEVFEFANLLTDGGVRHVIISQVIFRTAGMYRVAVNLNDRLIVYNERVRELARSSAVVDIWRHRGIWLRWQDLLVDGVHYTVEV